MIFDVFLFSLFYRPLYSPPNFLVVSYVSLFLDPLPRGEGSWLVSKLFWDLVLFPCLMKTLLM